MLKIALTFLAVLVSGAVQAQNSIVFTYADSASVTITLQETPDGIRFVRYDGDYVPFSGATLATAIALNPDIAYVELNSLGGELSEIGNPVAQIERLGLPVVIRAGEVCASACAFMALASPDIQIEGLLAFHLPFGNSYDKEASLYDISQSSVGITLIMTRQLFRQRWRLILYYIIQQNSGLDKWVVFSNTQQLNYFRFTDPATFTDTLAQPVQISVLTTDEIRFALASSTLIK